MRVLFCSWPGHGHLLPMVPLIRAAQQGGHDVVVSSGADMSELIRQLGVTPHRSGVTLAESYQRLPDEVTISRLPAEQQPGFAARHLFGARGVDRALDLLPLLREWRPQLVVHDTLELGSPAAAAVEGIPHVTHGYGPTVPYTRDLATGIGAALADGGFPSPVPAVFEAPYLDICPPGLQGEEPSPWTAVRPLQPSAGESTTAPLPLDISLLPHPATAYATLGTIMNRAPAVFRAVIDGCTMLPVNLILTTGPGVDPEVLGPLPRGVHAAQFLPQAAVLPHCQAVVSHAGAGTLLGALCHGLPQLCLPQGTDQPFNTAALLPTGAALALQPEEITAEAVAGALGRLLHEASFREAAGRLRTEIDQMPTPRAVLDELLADATA